MKGWETAAWRNLLGLKKSKSKLDDKFECHNVDSWVLARDMAGGSYDPDNKNVIKIVPLQFRRRQLHMFQFAKGGVRKLYGGMRSVGFKRGSIVKHKKYGICYIGGASKMGISLHSLGSGDRICRRAKAKDIKFLAYNSFRRDTTNLPRHARVARNS